MITTTMNHICMYTPTASGGHAQYTWELMSALVANGGDRFELVTRENIDPHYRNATYPVHPLLPALSSPRKFKTKLGWAADRVTYHARCERRLMEWLAARPDIAAVHFQEHAPWRAESMFRRIRATGRAVFYSVHNIRPHSYPPFLSPRRVDRWNRRAFRECDALFVLSERLRNELSAFLGPVHPPIYTVPHGVWSVPNQQPRPSLTERLSFKRLLFFGDVRRNKGLDILLGAAESLPDFTITIAGSPREPEYFRSEVLPAVDALRTRGVKIDLIDRFIADEEVPPLFASHSAVVLPYTGGFAAQSGVVFLALAHEVPVVATEAGGLRDLFAEFPVGTTFTDATPAGLVDALHRLYEHSSETAITTAIRAAKQRFSWSLAADETIRAYDTAFAARRDRLSAREVA